MKTFTRIDENIVQIDGVRYYANVGQIKPKWPTDESGVNELIANWQWLQVNSLNHVKANAICTCLDAARAINGDWEPNWEDENQAKHHPILNDVNQPEYSRVFGKECRDASFVWFHSEEACQHFIDHFSHLWLEAIG